MKKIFKKIKDFALNDIHCLNAKTADCYAFDLINEGKDWVGGWDWSKNLIDKDAQYLLMLDTGEVIENKRRIRR